MKSSEHGIFPCSEIFLTWLIYRCSVRTPMTHSLSWQAKALPKKECIMCLHHVRKKERKGIMPHKFETRPPTITQYTQAYELWTSQLRENARRIEDSTDARVFLLQNAESAALEDLLIRAVECIYDLTGDSQFKRQVIEEIERRRT